uniref:tRNA pseudouridine(55) synthase n=1 Tax=Denticeps clupeoides TaxID=299321 RepID=A0AAY4A9Y0_9TELE
IMLPLKEKDRPLAHKLLAAGCCARCVLRFCCVGTPSSYCQSYEDTSRELLAFVSDMGPKAQNDSSAEEQAEGPPSKKVKLGSCQSEGQANGEEPDSGVCVACLGVLQGFCSHDFSKKVSEAVKSEDYEFDNMVLFVSLPAQLSVREVRLHNASKCEITPSEKSLCLNKDDVIQVKEAFKWTLQGMLSQELAVPSQFEVGVGFVHPETDTLLETQYWCVCVCVCGVPMTCTFLGREYPCPPQRVKTACASLDTTCLHVSVFVAGRYNKFSRSLPQTPWVIDGERRMESSVEELITQPLLAAFKADGFNFSSSGREDVDVRTLGNGRPFAVELLNPHRAKFNKMEVHLLQEEINQSSDKIRVRDVQIVTREAVAHMKEGEEEKTKSYSALIWTQKSIVQNDIEFISDIKELKVAQKTPLRVLHRRPLAVRQRLIHTMSTRYLDPHHFYLHLRTQAGTYIKEFVHGDFGRTKPNLGELMKTEVDILELDVESVDVDWPPAIPE